mmetsp:Transcript_23945/g.50082  ORF Transcript_23945/g.50082 Transcript_23945/m.50082 type:complete len:292 (-) Transcript_23945:238-1113(-)
MKPDRSRSIRLKRRRSSAPSPWGSTPGSTAWASNSRMSMARSWFVSAWEKSRVARASRPSGDDSAPPADTCSAAARAGLISGAGPASGAASAPSTWFGSKPASSSFASSRRTLSSLSRRSSPSSCTAELYRASSSWYARTSVDTSPLPPAWVPVLLRVSTSARRASSVCNSCCRRATVAFFCPSIFVRDRRASCRRRAVSSARRMASVTSCRSSASLSLASFSSMVLLLFSESSSSAHFSHRSLNFVILERSAVQMFSSSVLRDSSERESLASTFSLASSSSDSLRSEICL